jgi:uncharacterized membrane protein (DUF106 family)
MDFLAQLVVWLNGLANALGRLLLAPVGVSPGWLSATVIAAVTGVLLLVVFKYTSNQRAIQRVRNDINANLLALKLFKDSASLAVAAQGRILWGAVRLLVLALVPMAIMSVPVLLNLGQLSLWYQQRPLRVGEDAVVTLTLHRAADAPLPEVSLRPTDSVEITVGPVRVPSKREVCWNIKACENGYHRLVFQMGDLAIDKELAIGDGYMRVSARRPGRDWQEALLYPEEQPFASDSPVQSIDIDYPARSSWISGTDSWWKYWLVASMIVGFCFRRVLNVNV